MLLIVSGYVTHYFPLIVTGRPFASCSACSPAVVGAYKRDGLEFVRTVLADADFLETLSGLRSLQSAAADACVDWDDDDDDDDVEVGEEEEED